MFGKIRKKLGTASVDHAQYETVEYKLVSRGVIGVASVGYVC